MNETISLLLNAGLVLFTGILLGSFFYSGLWWTTRKVIGESWAPVWFITSFAVRTFVVSTGFYLIAGPDWRNLLICLCGFIIARSMVSVALRSRVNGDVDDQKIESKHHAP